MIEIRVIDNTAFVVARSGRQERLLTPNEAIAEARAAKAAAVATLRRIGPEHDAIRVKTEEAVFFGEDAHALRAEAATLAQAIKAAQTTVAAQREAVAAIHSAVDQHHARQLQQEHAAHLAALLAPYDRVLKECRT